MSRLVDAEELATRFTFHPASADQAAKYEELRAMALSFAMVIAEHVPDCREGHLALTHLDQVVMFANAGIARRSDDIDTARCGDTLHVASRTEAVTGRCEKGGCGK